MPLSARIVDATFAVPPTRIATRGGRRAVPRHDEDPLTTAAEAALAIDLPPDTVLCVASVSSGRAEGGMTPILSEMLGLGGLTLELGGDANAGVEALAAAMALVAAGAGPVLVVATDHRLDPKGRPAGAGAVAVLLADEGDGGTIALDDATSGWFPDQWRPEGAPAPTVGDRSFASSSPGAREARRGATVVDPIRSSIDRVGNLGTAGALAALLLDAPRKGATRTVVASAGGSTRTISLTGGATTTRLRRRAEAARDGGVDSEPLPPVDLAGFSPYASEPRSWRERAQDLRLEGVEDTATGEIFYPPIPHGSGRPLRPRRLRRTGTVVTHTRDHVFPLGGPISMAVVDLDGGGRFYGQTAWDFPVSIGMRVRLVPRILHRGGGLTHYFWKIMEEDHADRR